MNVEEMIINFMASKKIDKAFGEKLLRLLRNKQLNKAPQLVESLSEKSRMALVQTAMINLQLDINSAVELISDAEDLCEILNKSDIPSIWKTAQYLFNTFSSEYLD